MARRGSESIPSSFHFLSLQLPLSLCLSPTLSVSKYVGIITLLFKTDYDTDAFTNKSQPYIKL